MEAEIQRIVPLAGRGGVIQREVREGIRVMLRGRRRGTETPRALRHVLDGERGPCLGLEHAVDVAIAGGVPDAEIEMIAFVVLAAIREKLHARRSPVSLCLHQTLVEETRVQGLTDPRQVIADRVRTPGTVREAREWAIRHRAVLDDYILAAGHELARLER